MKMSSDRRFISKNMFRLYTRYCKGNLESNCKGNNELSNSVGLRERCSLRLAFEILWAGI
jgi:hypothetical protein